MRRSLSSFVIITAIAVSTGAAAAEPDQETHRTELYREGLAAGDKGDWATAAKKFREVVAIRSAPKALIALAVAEEKSGHLAESKRLYSQALANAHEGGSSHADEARAANEALTRIAPLVPRVTPILPKDLAAPPRSYAVDGAKLLLQDGALEIDVGAHTIDVESADGSAHFTKPITVQQGDRLNVWVVFPAATEAPPEPPPVVAPITPPPDAHPNPILAKPDFTARPLPIGPIIVAGAGVVAAGVGSIFWAMGKSNEQDAKKACGGQTKNCPDSVRSTVDSAHSKIVVGNILFIGGLVLIAGGFVWWVVSPRSDSDKQAALSKHLCDGAICF